MFDIMDLFAVGSLVCFSKESGVPYVGFLQEFKPLGDYPDSARFVFGICLDVSHISELLCHGRDVVTRIDYCSLVTVDLCKYVLGVLESRGIFIQGSIKCADGEYFVDGGATDRVSVPVSLGSDVQLPSYADGGSSGMDVRAFIAEGCGDGVKDGVPYIDIVGGGRALIKTGVHCAIPLGYEIQVRPRSGLALRHGVTVLNTPGTVDSSYRGEVGVILFNQGKESFRVYHGDRIAQLVLCKVSVCCWDVTSSLGVTDRTGGFGHSGIK